MEHRWDLHYRRECNAGKERCRAVDDHAPRAVQCEYIAHSGHGHAALDGGLVWLDADWPGYDEPDDTQDWAEIPEWIRGAV